MGRDTKTKRWLEQQNRDFDAILSNNETVTGAWLFDGGLRLATTRITSADSPYTILEADIVIYADTDGGAITANLPTGVAGTYYRIINCGSSGNDLTLSPYGAELIEGANSSITLTDGDVYVLVYQSTEGWW